MSWRFKAQKIELAEDDTRRTNRVIEELFQGTPKVPLEQLMLSVAVFAQELPRHLRQIFYDFKLRQEFHAVCVHSQTTMDDDLLGATPTRHRSGGEREFVNRVDAIHLLFASLLGEPFAWSTIQNGYVLNDIMPMREHHNIVASSGFASRFWLHTEDAFHPWAGDYIGLLCLRNPDCVPTVFSGLDTSELSDATRNTLFEPRFIVGANVAQHVDRVARGSPILFGKVNDPYLRINLNATKPNPGDSGAAGALGELVALLERNAEKVVFQPGEFWYVDNLRVAHGRDVFAPRFDGRDRWLRRLYISSAFRYTRGMREHADGRVLDPATKQWSMNV